MRQIIEVFDVKQHPCKYGKVTELEKRVQSMENRFSKLYNREQVDRFCGFRTNKGTRFFVNGIYEWECVFLEYDDGEDGDMIPMEYDEEKMFEELQNEIVSGEADVEQPRPIVIPTK